MSVESEITYPVHEDLRGGRSPSTIVAFSTEQINDSLPKLSCIIQPEFSGKEAMFTLRDEQRLIVHLRLYDPTRMDAKYSINSG